MTNLSASRFSTRVVASALHWSVIAACMFGGIATTNLSAAADFLAEGFRNPPDSAKPLIIWQWMDGLVSRDGITADLEAFKRVGLGGVQNFQVGGPLQALANDPSVQIGNAKWRELMRFAMAECRRLGLTFGTHNCPGWSSSGSPDVRVEDSMQKLVWTEVTVSGPANIALKIERPGVDLRWNYYRDIAVLALPDQPAAPTQSVVNLSANMDATGELHWNAPAGKWIIFRFGHTTTGMTNANTAPPSGVGFECDKFSRAAVERYWAGYPAALLKLGDEYCGTTFTRIEIDSYEAGPQTWTPSMFTEFRKRRGYDLLPWLPVLAGKTIGGENLTQRFERDWKQTIADLFADNYYLYMDELARRTPGMKLLVEPYTGPFQPPSVSGGQSLLACEFWSQPVQWGGDNVRWVTSAAHTWGKPLVFAEAFTCWPLSAWSDDPFSLKASGDRAFAAGANLFMLHAGAQNPWPNAKPGMTMGKWGEQFVPGQTWWEHGGAEWMAYLARCQYLLQQGTFIGDICFLVGDSTSELPPIGYQGDLCGERAFLTRMSVANGRLVMPDGTSYQVLVLPDSRSMTVPIARKLKALVEEGAVVVGPKPLSSAGLENYPTADMEVKQIGDEVWSDCDGRTVTAHRFGQGLVIWGKSLENVLGELGVPPDIRLNDASVRWIHRRAGDTDLYFISNQKNEPLTLTASFRVAGRAPELWHADTGGTEPAAAWQEHDHQTDVRLELDPFGSVFVVFRKVAAVNGPGLQEPLPAKRNVLEVTGPWELRFPSEWGAPDHVTLERLASWSENENSGVRYFSGTATYRKSVDVPSTFMEADKTVTLDLGTVKNVAEVYVNGRRCGARLWKPPFREDVTSALKAGRNLLEIRVTNLWPNRMIGDEHEPDDCEWGEPFHYPYAPGNPVIGRFLARVPEWLAQGRPRPSRGRYTFVSFKFFNADSKLLPSGLLGPVRVESSNRN